MPTDYFILRLLKGLFEEMEKAFAKLRKDYPHHPFHCHDPRRRQVTQVLTVFFNNSNFIIMGNLLLKPGMRYVITPGLIDVVNVAPVPGATFVPKSNTVDNAAVAVIDADGQVAYAGIGKANLSSTNTWSYTDENTGLPVTQDITTTVPITGLAQAEVVQQTLDLTGENPIPAPAAQA